MEFQKLIHKIDKNTSMKEIEYIFDKIDIDHSKTISYEEFSNIFILYYQ
jgi:Ca2+-binding EF-hand superfamily protein